MDLDKLANDSADLLSTLILPTADAFHHFSGLTYIFSYILCGFNLHLAIWLEREAQGTLTLQND